MGCPVPEHRYVWAKRSKRCTFRAYETNRAKLLPMYFQCCVGGMEQLGMIDQNQDFALSYQVAQGKCLSKVKTKGFLDHRRNTG